MLLVKCDFSYSCAAANKISTDLRARAVSLRQLSYLFLHSLTKAPDNSTQALKITSSSRRLCHLKPCLLRVLLQLHFGVVADRFLWQGCATKVPRQGCVTKVYVCHGVKVVTHKKVFFQKLLSKVTCERNFQE